jgi:signal transduction histidine kinase/DNA-binding response OmpR family regulator
MNNIFNEIIECYNKFIETNNDELTSIIILKKILKLSKSKYGFITELQYDKLTKKYIPIRTISGKLNKKSNIFKCNDEHKTMDFNNPNNLLNKIIVNKDILISNDTQNDDRSLKSLNMPKDHFIIHNFLGIPLLIKDELIGIIGLANRKNDFDNNIINYLEPFIKACTSIFYGFKRHHKLEIEENISIIQNTFLSIMSHEIITPLNGIIGITDILKDTDLSIQQEEYIKIINSCSKHLHYLINNVLDFSKLKVHKLKLHLKSFNLRKCIEQNHDILIVKVNNNVNINYNIEQNVPEYIIGDENRLGQILRNLIYNSIKFTNVGQILTNVSVKERINNNYELLFSITDTGIGIPKDKLEIIFDKFYQLNNNSYIRDDNGTGLGLSICKKLIELMDGKIWAESEENVKTTFYFTIKVEKDNNNIINKKLNKKLENFNLLVIDDNELNRKILLQFLLSWNIKPILCSSSDEALLLINSNYNFDIILIDIHLPNMRGTTLAKKIYKNNPNIILIALSSLNELNDDDINLFNYILYKPIKKKKLYNILEKIIKNIDKTIINTNKINTTNTNINNSITNINNSITNINNTNNTNKKSKIKLLLIEDDKYNQIVCCKLLNSLGYNNIDIGNNGNEGLKKIKNKKYDIILLDIIMPITDGYTVSKIIKRKYPKLLKTIIILTAIVSDLDKIKFEELGIKNYITKPITKDILQKSIDNIIMN